MQYADLIIKFKVWPFCTVMRKNIVIFLYTVWQIKSKTLVSKYYVLLIILSILKRNTRNKRTITIIVFY